MGHGCHDCGTPNGCVCPRAPTLKPGRTLPEWLSGNASEALFTTTFDRSTLIDSMWFHNARQELAVLFKRRDGERATRDRDTIYLYKNIDYTMWVLLRDAQNPGKEFQTIRRDPVKYPFTKYEAPTPSASEQATKLEDDLKASVAPARKPRFRFDDK